MNSIELIILNFEEVRRRSVKVWRGIPEEKIQWKPDQEAMSCLEMVRHVLESEYYYHLMINQKGSLKEYPESPYLTRPFISIEEELEFAQKYRDEFLNTVRKYQEEDLSTINIDRSNVGYIRSLGDMLLRIAYHESIHTGQLLQYLRMMNVDRPNIWD
ncbi:DinB family protein [Peribacillus alkalitolerans]|uniref:DinB family protein n=1 Tax=Peribacillus alkalitolerans TaxID=1550385 RepID=UPI0013D4AD04|nr:DinB family protein [Peribacillus alkalitolerans]